MYVCLSPCFKVDVEFGAWRLNCVRFCLALLCSVFASPLLCPVGVGVWTLTLFSVSVFASYSFFLEHALLSLRLCSLHIFLFPRAALEHTRYNGVVHA